MKSSEQDGPVFHRIGLNRVAFRYFSAPTGGRHPTILALHGFTGSGEDFFPLRDALGHDAAHWLLPDWPGHGQSSSPAVVEAYQLPACRAILSKAVQMAPPESPLVLLGYSMGGRLAWHELRSLPFWKIFLLSTSPGLEDPPARARRREADAAWVHMLEQEPVDTFAEAWERQELIRPQTGIPEPRRTALARRRRMNTARGLAFSLRAVGSGTLPSCWSRLGEDPPTVLLTGERDPKFTKTAGRIRATYPQFHHMILPGCGHAPHLEAPEALAAVLRGELC
ncbi:MAG: alpha/beta fold hydrolase [Verrucomicrobia bacterium]|nr:alpha/beta fold hydrolase [Verrucomicrobiota bacterium]